MTTQTHSGSPHAPAFGRRGLFVGSGHRSELVEDAPGSSTEGQVVERYLYDPYGRVTVLDNDWNEIAWSASRRNEILFTGYRYNPETGTYQARNREYHPTLGRFMQRDPLGYVDGGNLYAGYFVMWGGVDPEGTQAGGADTEWVPVLVKDLDLAKHEDINSGSSGSLHWRHIFSNVHGGSRRAWGTAYAQLGDKRATMTGFVRVRQSRFLGLIRDQAVAVALLEIEFWCTASGEIRVGETGRSKPKQKISPAVIGLQMLRETSRSGEEVNVTFRATGDATGQSVTGAGLGVLGLTGSLTIPGDAGWQEVISLGTGVWKCLPRSVRDADRRHTGELFERQCGHIVDRIDPEGGGEYLRGRYGVSLRAGDGYVYDPSIHLINNKHSEFLRQQLRINGK